MTALLLTGLPGVGKTTVIRSVVERLPGLALRGFYTAEIRDSGTRRGFQLISFTGEEHLLAHVDIVSSRRVGRYGVDVALLEEQADRLLGTDTPADLYLVDEIGKMECLSARFVAAMRGILDARLPLLATVAARGGDFIAEVKQRPDTEVWEVTRANRDTRPVQVIEWLGLR